MYKEVKNMSQIDAAYIADLVDGEGTVTLSRRHRSENRHVVISISNTDRPLLEYVLNSVGAGKITNKRTSQPHHTPSYTYAISNRQALVLMNQIFPYLRTYKAKRSDIILRDYIRLTPRNGRYTPEIKLARTDFEQRVMKIKFWLAFPAEVRTRIELTATDEQDIPAKVLNTPLFWHTIWFKCSRCGWQICVGQNWTSRNTRWLTRVEGVVNPE
jgi:hypothetical protein